MPALCSPQHTNEWEFTLPSATTVWGQQARVRVVDSDNSAVSTLSSPFVVLGFQLSLSSCALSRHVCGGAGFVHDWCLVLCPPLLCPESVVRVLGVSTQLVPWEQAPILFPEVSAQVSFNCSNVAMTDVDVYLDQPQQSSSIMVVLPLSWSFLFLPSFPPHSFLMKEW